MARGNFNAPRFCSYVSRGLARSWVGPAVACHRPQRPAVQTPGVGVGPDRRWATAAAPCPPLPPRAPPRGSVSECGASACACSSRKRCSCKEKELRGLSGSHTPGSMQSAALRRLGYAARLQRGRGQAVVRACFVRPRLGRRAGRCAAADAPCTPTAASMSDRRATPTQWALRKTVQQFASRCIGRRGSSASPSFAT